MSKTFYLGRLLSTPGALTACEDAGVSPMSLIVRHARQDWGTLTTADKQANDRALAEGGRILSSYILPGGAKVWLITEADRSPRSTGYDWSDDPLISCLLAA